MGSLMSGLNLTDAHFLSKKMYIPDNWGGIVPKVVHYKAKNIYNYVFYKPNNMIMYIYI